MTKMITNPSAAFGQTDAGSNHYQSVANFRAGGTIVAGDGVAVLWDVTARTLLAHAWDTDASGQTAHGGIGVALDGAVTGETVRVVTHGFALANIGADTPLLGEDIVGTTTAGVLAAQPPAAATIQSTVIATCLGAEDGTTDKVPVWIHQ